MIPPGPFGIVCHYFHGDGHPKMTGSLSADDLRRLLDTCGSRVRRIDDWMPHLTDDIVVTFDDGLREAFDVALPVLEERGLTAAWLVPTAPLIGVPLAMERHRRIRDTWLGGVEDFYRTFNNRVWSHDIPEDYLADRTYLSRAARQFRYIRNEVLTPSGFDEYMDKFVSAGPFNPAIHWLSANDLRVLRDAQHHVGLHTHTHQMSLAKLTKEQQAAELATSKWILEQVLGEPVTSGAWPCGAFTDFAMQWCKDNGVTLMWGATMAGSFPYNVPRWSAGNWAP